jgi:hypothetical protein
VTVVAVLVDAADGVGVDAVVLHQRGGRVVLGRQRVGGTQGDLGAAGLQGAHQVGRLGGDVQAGRDLQAREGLLLLEAGPDLTQHRHVAVGPLDAQPTLVGEAEVMDVVRQSSSSNPLMTRVRYRIGGKPPARGGYESSSGGMSPAGVNPSTCP